MGPGIFIHSRMNFRQGLDARTTGSRVAIGPIPGR